MWKKAQALFQSKGLPWILVFLFGSGGVFQYFQLRNANKTQEIELAIRTTELRRLQNEQYSKVLTLVDEYNALFSEFGRDEKPELVPKMNKLRDQISIARDDLLVLETKIAKLEGKEPRTLRLRLPVARPEGLSVRMR